ncbi:hypothetical protein [uncultured Subdoligranulum sp.]|uniref:phage tail protein n=1 Tax=uncultured Subdoligranulum sp. TaxID=512298 RepID=UPI0025E49044|nr:hypothetical protein [uncultured Subdoligranulum sp.]
MPANVATAYVQIIPSAQGIGGGIAQALGGDAAAAGAGASIGGKLVGALKGVIAAAGLGAALGKALTEGAALEQSLGGVETLFKDSADQVIAAADNAYRTAGVSANKYMEQVTSFSATLLQGLGGDTAAAAGYADKAIVQMADNANKMGTDIASIQYAYQGFAKDNYTMLDNLKLGYGGTQAEMARLINDSGVLGDSIEVTAETVNDVPFDKIIDAIGVIQDDLGITGTTAQEAATTLSGSFASMQAAASNVLADLTLGRDIGPALEGLAQTVSTFLVGNLLPAVWNILSALPGALVTFVQSLGPQLAAGLSTLVPQMMTTGAQMLQSLSAGLVQGIPNFLAQALPMVLIITLVQGLISAVPTIIANIPTIIKAIADTITAFNWINLGATVVKSIGNGLLSMAGGLKSMMEGTFSGALDFLKGLPKQAVQWAKDMITGFVRGITDSIGGVISAVSNVASAVTSYLHFSRPDVGPLREYETWMPDFLSGIAKGITGNIYRVSGAMATLGRSMSEDLQTSLQSTARLRSAIAAGTPAAATVGSRPDRALLDAIHAAARDIVQAVQENGGDLVIGDDTIYRSYNRARQSQSIMTGGAY